jgi:hypothetical protein
MERIHMKMNRNSGTLYLALSLFSVIASASLFGHEGHDHRVLGTVVTATAEQVEIKTKEGKTVIIALNAQTKYLRGDAKAAAADLAAGDRVVVTLVSEKEPLVAKQIRMGRSSRK